VHLHDEAGDLVPFDHVFVSNDDAALAEARPRPRARPLRFRSRDPPAGECAQEAPQMDISFSASEAADPRHVDLVSAHDAHAIHKELGLVLRAYRSLPTARRQRSARSTLRQRACEPSASRVPSPVCIAPLSVALSGIAPRALRWSTE